MSLSPTVGEAAQVRHGAPTSVLICGMMRSGSTLLCDLLSRPDRSYVMSEPMFFGGWNAQRYEEIRAAGDRLRIALPPLLDDAARAVTSPHGSTYLGVDLTGEPPLMARADWIAGELPEIGETSLITVLGALEFVPRPAELLQALRDKGRPTMLTYHARDDTGAIPREELGWQSHLTRAELVEVFQRCRLRPQVLWRFDGYQSFFRLTPE
jgi:hypothetical protein